MVGGEPLVARVARRVIRAGVAKKVVVATDDERIADAVAHLEVSIHLEPKSRSFCSGTDRVAVAARAYAHDQVLNVQGGRDALERFASLPPSAREVDEGLEQLRALEAGFAIGVQAIQVRPSGINKPADLLALEQKGRASAQNQATTQEPELKSNGGNVG